MTAVEAFNDRYRLEALRHRTWVEILPTAPTTFTVDAMQADPLVLNGRLGRYTNFVNLLDCAAIAVPGDFGAETGLPNGVTLVAPACTDDALAPFADALHRAAATGMGIDRTAAIPGPPLVAQNGLVQIVMVGARLSGMPLNHELTGPGGRLVRACRPSRRRSPA